MEVPYSTGSTEGHKETQEFAAAPLVTQYAMDEPSATVPMEYDDATTESTPLYPVTNTAPCMYNTIMTSYMIVSMYHSVIVHVCNYVIGLY